METDSPVIPETVGTEDVTRFTHELEKEMDSRRRGQLGRFAIAIVVYSLVLLALAVIAQSLGFARFRGSLGGLMIGLIGVLWLPLITYVVGASMSQYALVNRIAQFDSADAIPVLIDAMSFRHSGVRTASMEALIRLLPRLKPPACGWYQPKHREHFREALTNCTSKGFGVYWPADYAVAVLGAVRVLEDTSMVWIVDVLANRQQTDEKSLRIREAARNCLVALERAAEQNRQREQLLRPTDDGDCLALLHVVEASEQQQSESLLLRPAEGVSADANLLRPASESGTHPMESLLRVSTEGQTSAIE